MTTSTIPTIVNRYPHLFVTIPDEPGEEIIHTEEHPFCSDPTCPCHQDYLLWQELIGSPVRDGLMTYEEGKRLFAGRQL